jgi:hypothetical protein
MMFPNVYGNVNCFGKREIPKRILQRAPVDHLKNCCQVLIKSVGTGYQWINIPNADFTAA